MRSKLYTVMSSVFNSYSNVLILLILVVASAILSPFFLTGENLINVFRASSLIGIVAVGMTFVMLTGGIDLSVGSMVALAGTLAAGFWRDYNLGFLIILFPLVVGAIIGSVNGVLVAKLKLQPFIATLVTMTILRGAGLVYTAGQPIYSAYPKGFSALAQGYILGVPVPAVIFLLVTVGAWFVLYFRPFGRYVYATGANEEGARLSGVQVDRIKITVYIISGVLAAFAGLILTGRMQSGEPGQAGLYWELDAIAAVVIGGTSSKGGIGNVWGTLIGALIIGILSNMFNLLGVDPQWQHLAKGLVIVFAVWFQSLRLSEQGIRMKTVSPEEVGVVEGCEETESVEVKSIVIPDRVGLDEKAAKKRKLIFTFSGVGLFVLLNALLFIGCPPLTSVDLAKAPYVEANNLELTKVYVRAIPKYEAIIEEFPDSYYAVLSRFGIANCFAGSGRKDEAMDMYDQLLEEYGFNKEYADLEYRILEKKAGVYRDEGDVENAEKIYLEIQERFPHQPAALEGERYLKSIRNVRTAETSSGGQAEENENTDFVGIEIPERIAVDEEFDVELAFRRKVDKTLDVTIKSDIGFWKGFDVLEIMPNPLAVHEYWGKRMWVYKIQDDEFDVTVRLKAVEAGSYDFVMDLEVMLTEMFLDVDRKVVVE